MDVASSAKQEIGYGAPVEMTKEREALPGSVVAEQKPFLSLSKNIPREGPLTPQISPLRCAPVEMTKGRAALPLSVVAEQDPFITLGGPLAHDFSGRKTFPGKDR